jgi:hypothetical protein
MEHGLQTVLPRVVDGGTRENWMSFEDFLRQINVETWGRQPALVWIVPSRDNSRGEPIELTRCADFSESATSAHHSGQSVGVAALKNGTVR